MFTRTFSIFTTTTIINKHISVTFNNIKMVFGIRINSKGMDQTFLHKRVHLNDLKPVKLNTYY